ncbi:D-3-phosphoglycerate dehydrogenase [Mycobacterium frederiksbergense]|uniref:D-3-phosphoglycerate dehydrogenase n=1 Tax=Mycolicibacterium frederiksbergense TaxID=117567 RepID=A0ABT6L1M0_9MYCO|nr:phosphoglycerate dehydrogenase [Mycolicibacterium frederiksbergense]MDH6196851.1 D-3-phosphoglycerate dehydrogenase [Mycolicibacterium frederiksbergense]
MTGNHVVITTAFLQPGDTVDELLRGAGLTVEHRPELDTLPPTQRAEILRGADAIIAGTRPLTASDIATARRLKIIVRTGVGYDSVDVSAATQRGIPVCVTAGANRQAVAEHVFALMLAAARRIPETLRDVERGAWDQLTGRELRGSTLGIVGLGSIGKAVAVIAGGFGMRIVAYDPCFDAGFAAEHGIERASLDDLLRRSDFLTLHIALTEETRHLIDARALGLMKSDCVVINTARGGIVDERALKDAVDRGRIAGAALDVFEQEPLPTDSPLHQVPQIVTTGHIAGATREARRNSGEMAARNVIGILNGGQPEHVVNPAYREASATVG